MDITKWRREIEKNVPVPLYYQLKQLILKEINEGNPKVGDSLPTESEISKVLKISRPTIRQALNELVTEGYIYRQKGKGTFVSKPKIDEAFFQKLESFNEEMIKKGLKPSTKVMSFKVIKGIASVNNKLRVSEEEKLIYLARLRFANDEPIVYVETYIPYSYCPLLIHEDLSVNSLYSLLEEKFGKKVVRASRKIEAVNSNSMEAKLLNMKKGQAICLVKTLAYTDDELPIEYSVARSRGDSNEFSIELIRKDN